ncbi:MAG: hypothetical protein ACXVY5_04060 [Gaiellales bacterium]
MGVEILSEFAGTATAAMLLAGLSCLTTGIIALMLTQIPGDPRLRHAFDLTRAMAVFGGSATLVGCLCFVPSRWLAGEIDGRTCLLAEMALVGVAAVWAIVAAVLLVQDETETR